MAIAHTTIVMTRYILIEWLRRYENDPKSFNEVFFKFADDIRDMDLTTALQNLMIFVIEFLDETKKVSKDVVKNQLQQWIECQASFIKALFRDFCWES
jgi:hypothetical protein